VGQQVRYRDFGYHDGKPYQDVESIYTENAAMEHLTLKTTQGPRSAKIVAVDYPSRTWARFTTTTVPVALNASPALVRSEIATGRFTVDGTVTRKLAPPCRAAPGLGATGWRDRVGSPWFILDTLVSVLGSGCVAGHDLGCGRSFPFDYHAKTVTCPQGKTSASWMPCTQNGKDAIVATFSAADCGPCPARGLCTTGKRRQLSLLPRDLAEAQAAARTTGTTIGFQADYARRAGVEGTASHSARRSRYRGLPKTSLDHVYLATPLNLLRLEAFWTGTPLGRQRTSHLARLELGLAEGGRN
jgi:Transposase DDE domain